MKLRKLLITTIATISLASGMGYIFTTNTQPVKAVSFEKLYNDISTTIVTKILNPNLFAGF